MVERPGIRVTGREPELALLTAAVAGLQAGRGRAALIEGEAGIGKSALLTELFWPESTNPPAGPQAKLDISWCEVVRAMCDELTERFPLSAVTQALDRSALASGERRAQPARPPADPGLGLVPGDPVLGAVEELLGLIHRMCARRPLVLAVEDMHWADEATVLLWRRLCRATTQLPLLLIGTRRPLPRGAPLERDVRACGGIVLSLAGLAAGDVARIAAELAGGAPGPRLLGWLESAAGNPFYVRELLDAALRSGVVRASGGQMELTEPGGLGGQVTSLRQAVASRLDFLADGELRVLRIASLLGPDFPVTELAAVTGQTPADLLPVVEDAIAAGILEPAGDQLRFRHGLLQQALYEGMSAPIRAGLHGQATQSLIELHAPAERIARQLMAAPGLGGDQELDWLASHAADLAGRVPEVAVALLEQALPRLARTDPRRARLTDQLIDALFTLGRYERVEQLIAGTLPDTADPDRYGHLTWIRAYSLTRGGQPDAAVAVLDAAAGRAGLSPVWQARFLAIRAMMLYDSGPAKTRATEAALTAAHALDDPAALAYALHARASQHFVDHEFTATLDLISRALPLTAGVPQLTDLRLLMVRNWVGLAGDLGRFDEARQLARQTLADYELSGSPRLGPLRTNAAGLAYVTGRWDEALAELDAMSETEDRASETYGVRALIAGHRDDWMQAAHHLADAQAAGEEYPHQRLGRRSYTVNVELAIALAREAAGEVPQAVRWLADWLDPGEDYQVPFWYQLMPALARLALTDGDEPTARAAAAAARRELDSEPRAHRQAVVAWCDGLVNADPAAVRDAARALGGLVLPLEAANALEDAAVLLAQAGEPTAARPVLDEALAGYEQLGATWDARRATARIRPHGVRPGVRRMRRPQTGWQSLTSTETQVAQLLAEGRSNPDIAAQLFISRRTVESHVSHILAKLQLTSRWEVREAAAAE